jgi:hypothetical protein
MKSLNVILIFFLIHCITSCLQDKNENKITYNLERKSIGKLSSFFTSEDSLKIISKRPIGAIDKIAMSDGFYYILADGNIYKVNINGEIISTLINEENKYKISNITTFDLYKNKLYVVERVKKRLSTLDANLNILDQISLPILPLGLQVLNDKTIAIYQGFDTDISVSNSQLVYFDFIENKIINAFLEVKPNLRFFNFSTKNNLFKNKEKVYFWNGLDKKLFELSINNLTEKFVFSYSGFDLEAEFYDNSKFTNVMEYSLAINQKDKVGRFYSLYYSGNVISKIISLKDKRYYTLKNLSTDTELTFENIEDDISNSGNYSVIEGLPFIDNINLKYDLIIANEDTSLNNDSLYRINVTFGKIKFH